MYKTANTTTPGAQVQHLMESIAGGPTLITYGDTSPIQEVLIYRDPYRARSYCYGMLDDRVQSTWTQTTRVTNS